MRLYTLIPKNRTLTKKQYKTMDSYYRWLVWKYKLKEKISKAYVDMVIEGTGVVEIGGEKIMCKYR